MALVGAGLLWERCRGSGKANEGDLVRERSRREVDLGEREACRCLRLE